MGNVTADGKQLWLSGRFDNIVYAIDTTTGGVKNRFGRARAAWSDGLAPAGALLARPYRQYALAKETRLPALSQFVRSE